MNLYSLKITPISSFVTFPKGDTLFGQFLYNLFLEENINKDLINSLDLENYENNPKFIFSDFMPFGYLPKPTLPMKYFFDGDDYKTADKKEFKKKNFIKYENLINGNLKELESIEYMKNSLRVRNSINRLTFTTDIDFAPYGTREFEFTKELWMFILLDESIDIESIKNKLNKLGEFGFGADSSIGRGRFKVDCYKKHTNLNKNSNFYLSISPSKLNNQEIQKASYNTFHRFGKYGQNTNNGNPFKIPIILADSGAIIESQKGLKYFGTGIKNHEKSLQQAYSIAIGINKFNWKSSKESK